MKKFENIKLLEFLVIFELIFENVNIGLNLGMTKRTFKCGFLKVQMLQMHLFYLNNAGSNDCPVSSK